MPVPGTCSFAGLGSLPYGSHWRFVPISAKNKAGQCINNNRPNVIDKGKDQQLGVSIAESMKVVK